MLSLLQPINLRRPCTERRLRYARLPIRRRSLNRRAGLRRGCLRSGDRRLSRVRHGITRLRHQRPTEHEHPRR